MVSTPILDAASHEVRALLERYETLLVEKSRYLNLVAPSTIPVLWERHFEDSAQLFSRIPAKAQSLADFGSGAGFPGLVLAIMGAKDVHLIESVGKKARFLQEVVDELNLDVTVHNARVEAIKGLKADIVTARAVTALPNLLSLAKNIWHKDTIGLFLKGQKADVELTEAKKYWTFRVKKTPSSTDASGAILKITDLKVRKSHGNKSRNPR